jgi:hypothetical protein
MASPRPVPPNFRVVLASAWVKAWNSLAGAQHRSVFGADELEPVRLRGRERRGQGLQLVDQGRQVHRLEIDLHAARLDLADVEQVVDESEQMLAGRLDALEIGQDFGLAAVGHLLLEDLGVADDRVERRAQLVTHAREEFGLGLIGLVSEVAGFLHRRLRGLLVADVVEPGHHDRFLVVDHVLPAEQSPHLAAIAATQMDLGIAHVALRLEERQQFGTPRGVDIDVLGPRQPGSDLDPVELVDPAVREQDLALRVDHADGDGTAVEDGVELVLGDPHRVRHGRVPLS